MTTSTHSMAGGLKLYFILVALIMAPLAIGYLLPHEAAATIRTDNQ
jgi:hypothetical protein